MFMQIFGVGKIGINRKQKIILSVFFYVISLRLFRFTGFLHIWDSSKTLIIT